VTRLPSFAFKKFVSILLVAFSLAIIVSIFHHHEDGKTHDTCPLCVYIAHHSVVLLQDDQPVILLYGNILISSENSFTLPQTFHVQFLIRAPPA
jgi:hypothetical protein